MKIRMILGLLLFSCLITLSCESKKTKLTKGLKKFLETYEAKVTGLSKEENLAMFNARINGRDVDYKKAEKLTIEMSRIHSNKAEFDQLKQFKEANLIDDPILVRELTILYNSYLANQIDDKKLEQLVRMQSEIERKFNTFRAKINEKSLSDNEIEDILRTSENSAILEITWKASKEIGKIVSADLLNLIKLRNSIAKELGFNNYHEMQLKLGEQDPAEILRIFDDLNIQTEQSYSKVKNDIDEILAKTYNIPKETLMPWHYQNRFFQEAPKLYTLDLSSYFRSQNLVELTKKFFGEIGLPVEDLIAKSDLYEKPGKYQHACCSDIDRKGDVRVIANIQPNNYWMNTILHEFGHAVYSKYHNPELPWLLRDAAHAFVTEGIAEFFGAFASDPLWMKEMLSIPEAEFAKISADSYRILRLEQLVFSRWSQVMYRFEKSMYENPDQDLNKLWWDLVERFQKVKRPAGRTEPDWASKIHIATDPAYYHNYLLGELFAAQLDHFIGKNILKNTEGAKINICKKTEVGKYLIESIFKPGMSMTWQNLIEKATGEKLNPVYYAHKFLKETY